MAISVRTDTSLAVRRARHRHDRLTRPRLGTSDTAPGGDARKDLGIWQELTWDQVWNDVLDAAHALLALGVEPGDRVSIHSEDRPEWVVLDIATVAVRAITVGLYPTNPAAEVAYLLGDSGATVHLAEDQEQVDKVFATPEAGAALTSIIYVEPVASPPTTTVA